MQEAFAVGKAKGVALDPSFVDRRMNYVTNEIEPDRKASMAYDLEHGRRLELDWLTGKVRTLGRTLGIPTPASDAVYIVLKLHRLGHEGRKVDRGPRYGMHRTATSRSTKQHERDRK